MEELFNGLILVLMVICAFILPPLLTVLNLLDLRREKHTKVHLVLTVFCGAFDYGLLYLVLDVIDVWHPYYNAIPIFGMHEPFSSQYMPSLCYFAAVGFAGLFVIGLLDNICVPLIRTFCIGLVYILNGLSLLMCIQLLPLLFHHPIALCLFYAYHFNIFILSLVNIRRTLRAVNAGKLRTVLLAGVFAVVTAFLMEFSLSFTSQGFRGLPRVFTQTSDWTFSRQTSPEPYNVTREQWDD